MANRGGVIEGAFHFDEMFQEYVPTVSTAFTLNRNDLKDLVLRRHDPPEPISQRIKVCSPFYEVSGPALREAIKSGCAIIYVTGNPGCGKTSTVSFIIHEVRPDVKVVIEQPRRYLAEKAAEFAGHPRAVFVHGISNNIKDATSETCVVFYTPGLGRALLEGVQPENVVAVFDEFHLANLSTLRCFRYCLKMGIQCIVMSATPHPNELQRLHEYYNAQVEEGQRAEFPVSSVHFERESKFNVQYNFIDEGTGFCYTADWTRAKPMDYVEYIREKMINRVIVCLNDVLRRNIRGKILIFCAELAVMKRLRDLLNAPSNAHLVNGKKVWIFHSTYNTGSFKPEGEDIIITYNGLQDGLTIPNATVCIQTCTSRITSGFNLHRIDRLQTVPSSSVDLILQSGRVGRDRIGYVYSIQSPGSYNALRNAAPTYFNVENIDSDAEFVQGCHEGDELFHAQDFYGNHIKMETFGDLQISLTADGAISAITGRHTVLAQLIGIFSYLSVPAAKLVWWSIFFGVESYGILLAAIISRRALPLKHPRTAMSPMEKKEFKTVASNEFILIVNAVVSWFLFDHAESFYTDNFADEVCEEVEILVQTIRRDLHKFGVVCNWKRNPLEGDDREKLELACLCATGSHMVYGGALPFGARIIPETSFDCGHSKNGSFDIYAYAKQYDEGLISGPMARYDRKVWAHFASLGSPVTIDIEERSIAIPVHGREVDLPAARPNEIQLFRQRLWECFENFIKDPIRRPSITIPEELRHLLLFSLKFKRVRY